MMKLFWTPEAIRDRDDIYDYVEAENPAAALPSMRYWRKRPGCWSIIRSSAGPAERLTHASWLRTGTTFWSTTPPAITCAY